MLLKLTPSVSPLIFFHDFEDKNVIKKVSRHKCDRTIDATYCDHFGPNQKVPITLT